MFNAIRRLSVRLNRRSSDRLEQDASLVLDTLVEDMQYTPSKAVKVALQAYGVHSNILPVDTQMEVLKITDEDRIARRVVEILQESNILQAKNVSAPSDNFQPEAFNVFD